MNCLPACGVSIDYISQFYLCAIRFFFTKYHGLMSRAILDVCITQSRKGDITWSDEDKVNKMAKNIWHLWSLDFHSYIHFENKLRFMTVFVIHNLHMRNQCVTSIFCYAWHFATNVNNWWEKYNTNSLF